MTLWEMFKFWLMRELTPLFMVLAFILVVIVGCAVFCVGVFCGFFQ